MAEEIQYEPMQEHIYIPEEILETMPGSEQLDASLYSNYPLMSMDTDLGALNQVRLQGEPETINPDATFQRMQLVGARRRISIVPHPPASSTKAHRPPVPRPTVSSPTVPDQTQPPKMPTPGKVKPPKMPTPGKVRSPKMPTPGKVRSPKMPTPGKVKPPSVLRQRVKSPTGTTVIRTRVKPPTVPKPTPPQMTVTPTATVPSNKIHTTRTPQRPRVTPPKSGVLPKKAVTPPAAGVVFPRFDTRVTHKPANVPLNVAITTLEYHPNQEMVDILGEIDPEKLIVGRKGARQSVYSLEELKTYARRMNLKVSGSKLELIDRIKLKMIEAGLL